MKTSLSLNELRVIRQEMVTVGRLAQQDMHLMEVVGVLISMYRDAELDLERRALSYVLVLLLEPSAQCEVGL